MKRALILGIPILVIFFALFPMIGSAEQSKPMGAMEQINYSVGHQIGTDFKNQSVEIRSAMLIQGIQDAVQSNKPLMTKAEMRAVLLDLKKMVLADEQAKKESYRGEGRDFLAANAKEVGVVTLASGLQYKILATGEGKSPRINDQIIVNYTGKRLDGSEFDSSIRDGKPATFLLRGLIKGWTEALQLMHEGDKWRLFVPADLAYGERGPLADQAVTFDIELVEVLAIEK